MLDVTRKTIITQLDNEVANCDKVSAGQDKRPVTNTLDSLSLLNDVSESHNHF